VTIKKLRRRSSYKKPMRETAGYFFQFWLFLKRALLQYRRKYNVVIFDTLLWLLSSAAVGLANRNLTYIGPIDQQEQQMCPDIIKEICKQARLDEVFGSNSAVLIFCILATVSGFRAFLKEKLMFYRQSSWGLSTTAYFFGKDLTHFTYIILGPFVYLSLFYIIANPKAGFFDLYHIYYTF